MRVWRAVLQSSASRIAIAAIGLLIFLHITVLYFYMRYTSTERQAVMRDRVIQKIINAIYLVQATPLANRQHAVQVMADPMLQITYTIKPKWKLQFRQVSFWQINHAMQLRHTIRNREGEVKLSIKTGVNHWLNFKAHIYSHTLLTQALLIFIEILVFAAIWVAAWSIHRFTRPLKHFQRAAERMGKDLKSAPIDIYGPAVVRETAQSINNMHKRIQDLIRDRTQMLAAISHDLRTPITRMKLRSQFVDDPQLLQNFTADLNEMENMINETLSFSQDDAAKEHYAKLDLVSMLDSICTDMRDMGRQVCFATKLRRVAFEGRSLALKRAFTNLINNAVNYADMVEVILHAEGKHISVVIEDNGPGIPEQDLEKVFAPFYRSDYSRCRETGGTGLGLAVTRDIIRAHNGTITLKNLPQGGLRAQVDFLV